MKTKRLTGGWITLAALVALLGGCATKPNEPFRFAQLCDPQLGMGGYEHDVEMFEAAVAKMNGMELDFVVICGDFVHHATDEAFADALRIRDQLEIPFYCVSGNHDVRNEPTPESLARYRALFGEDQYAFRHKGYGFVVVNTQLWKAPLGGETERQNAWLKETLADFAAKETPVFVLAHYPLFLNAPDEPDEYMNLPKETREELLDLFGDSGVVAVLGGHVHRFLENEYRGMQLVNGETTSKNFDHRPMGFRVWRVEGDPPFQHAFVELYAGSN